MISKLGVGILTVAALLIAVPSNVFAATSSKDKEKIKKFSKQLNKLPNGASPASKVSSLVKKLSKLDPKKAGKYYKTGLKKLAKTQANKTAADKLATDVNKIVQKSGLPESQIKKITGDVTKQEEKFTPTPTPTSPSAMLLNGYMVATA